MMAVTLFQRSKTINLPHVPPSVALRGRGRLLGPPVAFSLVLLARQLVGSRSEQQAEERVVAVGEVGRSSGNERR